MKKVFTKTSGLILAVVLLCNSISAIAMNAEPVKDAVVEASANTIKEVAKNAEMATAASNLWQNIKVLMSIAAQQGATFIKNHRTAVMSGVAAATALFVGYKCFKYLKGGKQVVNKQTARQQRLARAAAANEDAATDELVNNYMVQHPEIKDRSIALAHVLEEQGAAIDKAQDHSKATHQG